jgi:uncharacterized ion transporter superfamily protein YfcC
MAWGWSTNNGIAMGERGRGRMPHAIMMMLAIIVAAVGMTYVVPSGAYRRDAGGRVEPGTFHVVPKDYSPVAILEARRRTNQSAYPVSPVAIFSSIPAGMVAAGSLIFMILFIGGMFGVLRETGALDAGIERLLGLTRGNVYLLVTVLMVAIACGSTFLGLISEYLVLIPVMVALAERFGLDALVGTAIVAIAAKIGYMTSVTNPLPLVIAQPIVGVATFSGAGFRLTAFFLYLTIGIGFLLRRIRAQGVRVPADGLLRQARLEKRHAAVLGALAAMVAVLIYGARARAWGDLQLAALYLFAAVVIALLGRLPSSQAAEAFLKGMSTMLLAAVLVGLARAVELVLRDGMILDSVIHGLSSLAAGKPPVVVAQMMVLIQMAIDVFIPSTSGQAAVTMPILGPIGHLAGVSGQTSVVAFIFGNGLTNAITPTSGMLLAYLATGKVSYGAWVRFVLPLVAVLLVLSLAGVSLAVATGY